MQFCVNYSYSSSLLLQAKRIAIDCWKLFESEQLVHEASALKPVRVHFSFQAGSGDVFLKDKVTAVEKLLGMTDTTTVNTHLAILGNPSRQEYIDRVGIDIEELCRLFGRERVIAENVFPQGINIHPGADATVISEIILSHGVGFLFDIAHAKLAAHFRGEDVYSYIMKLPLQRVREIHISGTKIDPATGLLADHFPVTEHDYTLFDWVFGLIQTGAISHPDLTAVELGGVGGMLEDRVTLHDLAEALPRLQSLISIATQRQAA